MTKKNTLRAIILEIYLRKISKNVDYHIQPVAKKIKSYIQDTLDFIEKLTKLVQLLRTQVHI